MVLERVSFRSRMRDAAVQLLKDYSAEANIGLTVYRARPRSIHTPQAFIDNIRETVNYSNVRGRRRVPLVEVFILWGLFDSGEAVDQADIFVDDFLNWVTDRPHAAGATTLISVQSVEDEPTFVPDWIEANRMSYYATRITLEGFVGEI